MVGGSLVVCYYRAVSNKWDFKARLSELRWTQSDEKLTCLVQFAGIAFLASRIRRAAILDLRKALGNKSAEDNGRITITKWSRAASLCTQES